MRTTITLILLAIMVRAFPQIVYESVQNQGIYEYLDELAGLKIIQINSAVKPWSRQFIARSLETALNQQEKLSKRQLRDLHFYLQDYQMELPTSPPPYVPTSPPPYLPSSDSLMHFDHKLGFLFRKDPRFAIPLNPLSFSYRDRLFRFSLRPILGMSYAANENGNAYHRYWGGSMFGYIGKNFGFYANLRDNNENVALAYPGYFTLIHGAIYKPSSDYATVDFSEMNGGITVSWNWGSFGLLKDRFIWGNNYHGANIFSGKQPTVPYIHLHLKPARWFEFNYLHGWLNSGIVDSSRSYYSGQFYREIFYNKFIAANLFTFTPWKQLNLSFGNSIVYSADNIQPAFLIPFMFFNSVDATNSEVNNHAGQNSQIFFDLSSRQIKHLHLWVTLFIDELKVSRVTDPGTLNWTSWKAGLRLTDLPLRNLFFTAEWTKTNPITYKHYISTTTFASNDYCMGHYLRDNSQEIYLALGWKPLRGLMFNLSYTIAEHGDEYIDDRTYDYSTLRFMENKTWQNNELAFSVRYEYTSNGYFFLQYLNSDHRGDVGYSPEFMHGKTNTILAGVNLGF